MAARLGQEAHERRLRAGLRLIDIADSAGPGISRTTVHAFEQGMGWRRETDRIVDAYAHELGIAPEALWRAAIERLD